MSKNLVILIQLIIEYLYFKLIFYTCLNWGGVFFYRSSINCLRNCRRPAKFGAWLSGYMIGRGHENFIDLWWIPQQNKMICRLIGTWDNDPLFRSSDCIEKGTMILICRFLNYSKECLVSISNSMWKSMSLKI